MVARAFGSDFLFLFLILLYQERDGERDRGRGCVREDLKASLSVPCLFVFAF